MECEAGRVTDHEPPAAHELARAKEIIGQLEAKGRGDLVAPLRQMLASKAPPENKSMWGRLFGGGR